MFRRNKVIRIRGNLATLWAQSGWYMSIQNRGCRGILFLLLRLLAGRLSVAGFATIVANPRKPLGLLSRLILPLSFTSLPLVLLVLLLEGCQSLEALAL